MNEQARIDRMMELRSELFDLANSFAGEETGTAATILHEACNNILRAKSWLEGDLTVFDYASCTLSPNDVANLAISTPRVKTP